MIRGMLVLAALIATVDPASAQFEVNPTASRRSMPGRLQVTGFVGGMNLDQSLGSATNLYQTVTGAAENVTFGKLYGMRASWSFTPSLAAEFNVSSSSTSYSYEVDDTEVGAVALGEQVSADQLLLSGNIVFQVPVGNFVPYLTGGVGMLRTNPSSEIADIDRISALDFNVGGGVKFWFSSVQWLGLRGDVRYHAADEGLAFPGDASKPKGFEFTVGASFRWF